MKKTICTILFLSAITIVYSQSTVGLIAHWDMNGTVNDITGNGHNGTATALTASAGQCGNPGTAYTFNGTTSGITVANKSDLNLTNYSICAIVRVTKFYTGLCQGNFLLVRGNGGNPGDYMLGFDDNSFDSSCSHFDTTFYVFNSAAGPDHNTNSTSSQYLPTISENIWYRVIATYDGAHIRMYINGVLKSTAATIGTSIGTSSDGISIGYNQAGGSTFPYPFTGQIDDICLYNRVLTVSEITDYGATGPITIQPTPVTVKSGHNTIFTVATSLSSPAFQWQKDTGAGFTNLANTPPFSGVTTDTLVITNATAPLNGTHYRCIVSNSSGCPDTSSQAALTVMLGVNNLIANNDVHIYPNPAHEKLIIDLDNYSDGTIQVLNNIGQVLNEEKVKSNTTTVDISTLPIGMYLIKLKLDNSIYYSKIIKE